MSEKMDLNDCLSFITSSVEQGLSEVGGHEGDPDVCHVTIKLSRMVIELFKESLTNVNRVNPDESLRVLIEIEKAITTAKITDQPLDELYQLKADVEMVRAINE